MQAYQRLQIQQQMLQAQRNVSGPIRQQEQQVRLLSGQLSFLIFPVLCHSGSALDYFLSLLLCMVIIILVLLALHNSCRERFSKLCLCCDGVTGCTYNQ